MENYIFSIRMAFLFFPFLAALFTLPFLLLQYHRYGAVPILRAAVVYSMMLYLLCTYFLVILPLPSVEEAAARTDAWYNLKPFVAQWRYLRTVRPDLTTLSAWKAMARSQVWQEPALNVLMLIPFGVYLRYYFGRSWWQTVLASLALSAFFELTQLSGLYGIYPRPYRLCDVTDLITNTTGGLVGFWLAPLFSFFLPSRERLREIAYQRGQKVSMLRRGLAFLLDWSLVGIPLVLFAAPGPLCCCGCAGRSTSSWRPWSPGDIPWEAGCAASALWTARASLPPAGAIWCGWRRCICPSAVCWLCGWSRRPHGWPRQQNWPGWGWRGFAAC